MKALSEKAQAALDRATEKMRSGTLSPLVEVARLRRSPRDVPTPWDTWSPANQALTLLMAGSTDCRGYRQWQKVGRHVRKGAKAPAFVLVPLLRKVDKDNEDETPSVYGFRARAVWPLELTDGEPLPPPTDYTPEELPPLLDVAARLGVPVSWSPYDPKTHALGSTLQAYHWTRNGPDGEPATGKTTRIALHSHDRAVFFHELAHAALALAHGSMIGGQHPEQEIPAEMVAAVISEYYGEDVSGNAWRYISHYSDDPLTALRGAMKDIELALSIILDGAEPASVATGETSPTCALSPDVV